MLKEEDKKRLQERFQEEASDVYQPFSKELFKQYSVKRGLRNDDGTGVMAGLTSVGAVLGYYIDDGEKIPMEGHLRYRGYDLTDIVKNCEKEKRFGFEEVAYLLLFGHLPDKKTLDDFSRLIGNLRVLPEGFAEDMILKAPSKNIMNKIARSVLASYSYDSNPDDISTGNILRQSIELIARLPVMAAYGYQAKSHYHDGKSLYLHTPQPRLSTAENLLYMIRPDNKYTREEAEMLDVLLMIHAEHGGGNNSAFTTRVVSSSDTDTYSAIAAAIGVVMPSLIIIMIIAAFLQNFANLEIVQNAFWGIRVVVAALIFGVVLSMFKTGIIDKLTFVIFVVVFLCSVFLSLSPIWYVVGAALCGLVATRLRKAREGGQGK